MENIYIKTLEIGVENINKGISYNEVKKEIGSLVPEFETAYINWFYNNFYNKIAWKRIMLEPLDRYIDLNNFNECNNQIAYLTGDGHLKYIEYLELKEARKSAKRAYVMALIAIVISAIAASTSIVGVIKSHYNAPPTVNVNVTNDRDTGKKTKFDDSLFSPFAINGVRESKTKHETILNKESN